jgi:hypothetical protein
MYSLLILIVLPQCHQRSYHTQRAQAAMLRKETMQEKFTRAVTIVQVFYQ